VRDDVQGFAKWINPRESVTTTVVLCAVGAHGGVREGLLEGGLELGAEERDDRLDLRAVGLEALRGGRRGGQCSRILEDEARAEERRRLDRQRVRSPAFRSLCFL